MPEIHAARRGCAQEKIAEAGADCICLAATDAPLRFRGVLPRLAQPFLRI